MFRFLLILCTVLYFVDVGEAGMLLANSALYRGRNRIQNSDWSNRRRLGGLSYVPDEEENFRADRDPGTIFSLILVKIYLQ